MDFFSFIQNYSTLIAQDQKKVINFFSDKYSVLFFSILLKKFKPLIEVKVIDLNEHLDTVAQEINVSFLGSMVLCWIGNIDDLNEKDRKAVVKIIQQYKGPNIILFFSEKPYEFEHIETIELSRIVNAEQFKLIALFAVDTINKSLDFCINFYMQKYESFSVDQAIILSYYGSTTGSSSKEFNRDWLEKIMNVDHSLFTLATLLFAKDKQFFKLWLTLKDEYNPVFWTVFWSDQFFRAYWYLYFCKRREFAEAKKISYKLPFSFINFDWKKHELASLKQAHEHFYLLDCVLKNGATFNPESFFIKFIQKS